MTEPPRSGDRLPSRTFGPVTMNQIVRYQGASGDFNPIHHDPEYARSAGYPGPFAVGMLQAGFLATYVTDIFGPERVRWIDFQFREQVWPGDVLQAEGSVDGVAGSSLTVSFTLARQGGGIAVRGRARFSV